MGCPIDKAIAFNCAAIQPGGIEAEVIVLNYDQWKDATVTVDATSNEILTIVLANTGDAGYLWQSPKDSNIIATHALRVVDGADGYDHQVDMRIQTVEQKDTEAIAKMRFNKIVVIVKQADGRGLLIGAGVNATPSPVGVGMRISEDDANIGDAAVGGTSHFIAKTPDTSPPELMKPHLIAATFDFDAILVPVT